MNLNLITTEAGWRVLPDSHDYKCCINLQNKIQRGVNFVKPASKYSIECSIAGSGFVPDILSMSPDTVFLVNFDIDFIISNDHVYRGIYSSSLKEDKLRDRYVKEYFQLKGYQAKMWTAGLKIDTDAKGVVEWIWNLVPYVELKPGFKHSESSE